MSESDFFNHFDEDGRFVLSNGSLGMTVTKNGQMMATTLTFSNHLLVRAEVFNESPFENEDGSPLGGVRFDVLFDDRHDSYLFFVEGGRIIDKFPNQLPLS